MAARCLLLVWVKSAKGIPQPRANVFQERGRCWGILPSGGAVLGIVPGHGGHRHRQDLRQPVLDGGDDLEEMKSGLSSQKGITMLRQHRTIPALRLKHRSGSCGTASAAPRSPYRHLELCGIALTIPELWHICHNEICRKVCLRCRGRCSPTVGQGISHIFIVRSGRLQWGAGAPALPYKKLHSVWAVQLHQNYRFVSRSLFRT